MGLLEKSNGPTSGTYLEERNGLGTALGDDQSVFCISCQCEGQDDVEFDGADQKEFLELFTINWKHCPS